MFLEPSIYFGRRFRCVECLGGSGKDSRCFVCNVDVKKSIRVPRRARLRRDIAAGTSHP